MEAKWDHLLERGEGGARIQPYDPQIYGTLEHALRGEGRDSQADDVYRFGREVEDAGLPLSSRVRYFVWGELLGYGTGYRAWVISLVVVLLGGIYFRFASKEGKLNLGKAMDRSLLEIFEDCSMRRSAGAQSVFVEDPTRRRLCPERFRPPPCSGGFTRRLSFSVPRGAPPSLRKRTTRARPYGAIDLCSRLWVWLWLSFGVDFPGAHDRWELVRSIESREKTGPFSWRAPSRARTNFIDWLQVEPAPAKMTIERIRMKVGKSRSLGSLGMAIG